VRLSDASARFDLAWRADAATIAPARSVTVRFDRAVVVETIETAGVACEVIGALVCEVPELAPGQVAGLRVRLGTGHDAVLARVVEAGADGVLRDRRLPIGSN
jgi:hypothetical protein